MKKNIHPQRKDVMIMCTCGAMFKTSSTKEGLKATLCSACHPFFTGKQKFVDTAGRIDKFKKKFADIKKK